MLLDCGNGILSRLQRFHAIQEINAIFLSHLHFDHIGDLFLLRYAYETMLAFGDGDFLPVPVYLPETPHEIVDLLRVDELFALHFMQEDTNYTIGELQFRFQRMQHSVECYGMSVSEGDKRLVYSGDALFHEALIEFVGGADMFLCEATISGKDASPVPLPHLSARQAGEIAAQAQVGRLLLTHSGFMEDKQEILQCAKQYFAASELVEEMRTYEV